MSDDLVKRLREIDTGQRGWGYAKNAADRIEELKAELAEYKYVASAIDTQWAESQDEIADLKAKLEKAVGWFDEIRQHCANFGRGVPSIDERIIERCESTAADALEELTGGKDE